MGECPSERASLYPHAWLSERLSKSEWVSNRWVTEWVGEWQNEWPNEWVRVTEWVNDWVCVTVCESLAVSLCGWIYLSVNCVTLHFPLTIMVILTYPLCFDYIFCGIKNKRYVIENKLLFLYWGKKNCTRSRIQSERKWPEIFLKNLFWKHNKIDEASNERKGWSMFANDYGRTIWIVEGNAYR